MKRFFEKYSMSEVRELIADLLEYCLPLLAGAGVLHFFLCDNGVSLIWRIIVYVLAGIIALFGFAILSSRRDDIAKQSDEIKELQKVKKWYEETSARLDIAESLLTEEQRSEYYSKRRELEKEE